jgi:hypothetical protein
MAQAFLNRCIWTAVGSGTGSFVVSAAAQNGYTPAGCLDPVVVNGATYHYFAFQGTDHEEGDGVYTTSTSTLTRAVIRNSSNGAAVVNFASPPTVIMGGPTSLDMPIIGNPIGGGAANGLVYADASGNWGEDATNLFWVDSTQIMTVFGSFRVGTVSTVSFSTAGFLAEFVSPNATAPIMYWAQNGVAGWRLGMRASEAAFLFDDSSDALTGPGGGIRGTNAFATGYGFGLPSGGQVIWVASADPNGTADAGIGRSAAKVVEFTDGTTGNTNGWMQWQGEARVTADVAFTSTTTLANITGLTVNVAAGRTYSFQVEISWTDAAAGGIQLAMSGTATATNIIYDGWIVDSAANGIKGNAQATALGTAVANAATTGTAGHASIFGTITVNAAGTLTVQAAQSVSNGTATTIKRGSRMIVFDMP